MGEMIARVFVDASDEVLSVLNEIERLERGLSVIEIDVRRNTNRSTDSISADDWLLFSTTVEVFGNDHADDRVLVELSLLLNLLDLLGVPYVTASEYEELLQGGGRRLAD